MNNLQLFRLNRTFIAIAVATGLLVNTSFASETAQPATQYTQQINQQYTQSLPFNDRPLLKAIRVSSLLIPLSARRPQNPASTSTISIARKNLLLPSSIPIATPITMAASKVSSAKRMLKQAKCRLLLQPGLWKKPSAKTCWPGIL